MPDRQLSHRQLSDRQTAILAQIEAKGFVTLEALAETFAVSMQTARRDVIAMQDAGLIERFHGGAGARARLASERIDHAAKRGLLVEEKRRIAERAAALTPPGAVVYLDVGTTLTAAAAALARKDRLTIVTNSLHAAAEFDPARHDVHVLPGRLSGPDGSLTGEATVLALRAWRLDLALIGCSGIEPDGAVMDFDLGKIAVKRVAMQAARVRLLLATRDKFGRTARVEIAGRDAFDHLLSDAADAGPAENPER